MGSRKTLYIILIVGLVIFVVTLAIGRSLWQALLFSVMFLLIAAIVSSTGLLIPEKLFGRRLLGRRLSEKPTESTGKAQFLKGMESVLDGLALGPGATLDDIHWMTEYVRVMKEVGELAYEVHENVQSKDRVRQLRAFRGVAKQLPSLISEFKNIPEPITSKKQETMDRQIRGMDLYLLACSTFAEAFETSDGELAGIAAEQINEALQLLNLMDKSAAARGWR